MAFGQPYQMNDASPVWNAGFDVPHPMAAAAAPKPKINWLGVLADALSGAAGQPGMYAREMMRQREQETEDQRYFRHHQQQIEDEKNLYLWKQAHPETPAPNEYERALQAAGIAPGTPEYVQHMGNYIKMKENPTWTYTDPATGALMMGSKGPPQAAPSGVTFTPLDDGGPSPSGSGGFRRPK
jgi:hypothetical protein